MTAFALEVDFLKLPTTPLSQLVFVIVFVLIAIVIIAIITQLFSHQVDRKWPATEPLDATELLWGEMSGYVQSTFKGLDLDVGKRLADQMVETKVPAGTMIVRQGDPATAFYVLKKGKAEVLQRDAAGVDRPVREYDEGASFGEVAILKRTTRTASVRAVTDCVLLQLDAADYVAAAAVSAFHGDDLFALVDDYLAQDRAREMATVGAAAGGGGGGAAAAGAAGAAAAGAWATGLPWP